MDEKKFFFMYEPFQVIQKIQNQTVTKEDLQNLSRSELIEYYSHIINNIVQRLSLLEIACLTKNLSIVKLFDFTTNSNNEYVNLFFYINLDFIRLNDLGEDIYLFCSEKGCKDKGRYLENTKDSVYNKHFENENAYKNLVEETEKKLKKNEKIDIETFSKLKLCDLNKKIGDDNYYFYNYCINEDLEVVKKLLNLGVETQNFNYSKIKTNILTEIIIYCLKNKIPITIDDKRVPKIISEVVVDKFIILSP